MKRLGPIDRLGVAFCDSGGMPSWRAPMGNHPGLTARVWRYMPFDQFTHLFETSALHLHRLDLLAEFDPDEGRWVGGVEDELRFTHGGDQAALITALDRERHRTFVSCWTLGLDERREMWDRGGRDLAVVTTYGNLIGAIEGGPVGVAIGGVSYVDSVAEFVLRHPRVNTYNLAFCKRTAFRDELEIRVVHQDHGDSDLAEHVMVPVDLGRLSLCIVLRPGADPVLAERAQAVLARAGFTFPVVPSKLA